MTKPPPTIPGPGPAVDAEENTLTAALFRDEANLQQLEVTIDGTTGYLTATLITPHLDAFGHDRVVLRPRSAEAVTLIATVTLSGYDAAADTFHHIEASLSVDWSPVGHDPRIIDVAGAALLTDLDEQSINVLRAVRHHPHNQLGSPRPSADEGEPGGTAGSVAPHRRPPVHREEPGIVDAGEAVALTAA